MDSNRLAVLREVVRCTPKDKLPELVDALVDELEQAGRTRSESTGGDVMADLFSDLSKKQKLILRMIANERFKQDAKWGEPKSRHYLDLTWLAVLTEEVGEVARACLKNDDAGNLGMELIQVAAVAVAWLEARHPNQPKGE